MIPFPVILFSRASAEGSAVVNDVVWRISVILRFLYGLRSLIIDGLDVVKFNTSVQDLLFVEVVCALSSCSMSVLGFSFKILMMPVFLCFILDRCNIVLLLL